MFTIPCHDQKYCLHLCICINGNCNKQELRKQSFKKQRCYYFTRKGEHQTNFLFENATRRFFTIFRLLAAWETSGSGVFIPPPPPLTLPVPLGATIFVFCAYFTRQKQLLILKFYRCFDMRIGNLRVCMYFKLTYM